MAPSPLRRLPKPVVGISAATFASLSKLRRRRVFHPDGRAFDGRLELSQKADRWLPQALAWPRTHDVIVRFSRGAGLPQFLPDVLGLAIKIPNLYGASWDQDFLLVTSAEDPVRRHALIPAMDYMSRSYSTVLPYRSGSRLVTFGARPRAGAGRAKTFDELDRAVAIRPLEFDFTVAAEGDAHVVLGRLAITATRPETGDARLRFNPWNTSSQMRPAGALNELRRESYRASQKARPDSTA